MAETDTPAFPPQPWRLTARAVASVWLAPADDIRFVAPPGWRPVRIAGRVAVGGAIAEYDGDLAYRELVVAVLMRKGPQLGLTIPWIWVDSPASRAGARVMWAIPKELAVFGGAGVPGLAVAHAAQGARLPGRWPLGLRIVQPAGQNVVATRAKVSARLRLTRATWEVAGPLAMLPARPLMSLRLDDARLLFGDPGEAVR